MKKATRTRWAVSEVAAMLGLHFSTVNKYVTANGIGEPLPNGRILTAREIEVLRRHFASTKRGPKTE